jgi:lipopolysaccharide export system protein LptA
MWQKRLRFAIALFVVVFAAVVVVSLQRGHNQRTANPQPVRSDPAASIENRGGGVYERSSAGKTTFSLKFERSLTYADGRTRLWGVRVELPDKSGRSVTITARHATVLNPPDKGFSHAEFDGDVKLVTSDGITVTSERATYDEQEGIARIPGPLKFSKGRMNGTGTGATYDRVREVLWLLDAADVKVAADPKDSKGSGAVHITSKAAGLARLDHYMKFTGGARLEGDGRVTVADEATAYLTQDDDRVTLIELRGNAHMTGSGNGPQSMQGRDIDLRYGPDGRTLQGARLMENATVQLPGQSSASGRSIAGKTIEIALGPDGSTVTSLTSNENVEVTLPGEGDLPARRIRSVSLVATGAAGTGLQNATFAGPVEYRESRAPRSGVAAIERTARSLRLDVQTKPGFGDLERAEFHGNVHFTDGSRTTADAPVAVYSIKDDRLDLSPSATGDPGTGPHVSDGRINVDARTIQMVLGTQKMNAETKVRSLMQSQKLSTQPSAGGGNLPQVAEVATAPQPPASTPSVPQGKAPPAASQPSAKTSDAAVKMPAMLKQNEPVTVTANRLEYDGATSLATYTGTARLWQEDTEVRADTIVLDDKNGNLRATANVRTMMTLAPKEEDAKARKGKPKTAPQPTITVAEALLYEDAQRRATYTTKAHMSGPDGDVTADKIELYLTESGGELERAEAYGHVASRQETRRAYGTHLTYVAAKDEYTMVGTPVEVYDDTSPDCKLTKGTTLTFHKAVDTITASGNGVSSTQTKSIACGAAGPSTSRGTPNQSSALGAPPSKLATGPR